MSMPADAITVLTTAGASNVWPMNETTAGSLGGGATFADAVGGRNLSSASGCSPNGWGPLYGYRNNGGPQTPGATFDGSTNAYASSAGATIGGVGSYWNPGGTGTGVGVIVWADSVWKTVNGMCLYSEGTATSTERIAFYVTGSVLSLRYVDSGGSATPQGGGNSRTVIGGQSSIGNGVKGGQLLGFSVQPNGQVQFYANARQSSALSSAALPNPSAWAGGMTTYVGKHPSTTSSKTANVLAAYQGTATSNGGANEAGSNLLQTNATSTTGWTGLSLLIGTDTYYTSNATLFNGNVLLTLTANLKTNLTPGTVINAIPYSAWRGTLGWCAVFPFAYTAAQFDSFYQALTPEPTTGPAWKRSRSGAFLPLSQLWCEPLAGPYSTSAPSGTPSTPAPVDPNSAAIISFWNSLSSPNNKPTLTNSIPMFDLDHAGRATNPDANGGIVRAEFLSSFDQSSFLARMPVPGTDDPQNPLPAANGSDSQSSKNSPQLGLHYNTFHQMVLADRNDGPRAPIWQATITSATAQTGVGTLPPGTYVYAISSVLGDGTESTGVSYSSSTVTNSGQGTGLLHGTNFSCVLGGTGTITLGYTVNAPAGYYYNPAKLRVYRRGPGSSSNADFRLLAEVTPVANGAATYKDNGSLTPNAAVVPYSLNAGLFDPTVQQLCQATFGSGTVGPISYQAIFNNNANLDQSKQVNVIGGAVPVIGARAFGPGIAPGTKIAASPAPTQTQFYVTIATASAQTNATIAVDQWSPAMTVWGQMGPARGQDCASIGGGGCWDWWVNAVFIPSWRPSTADNNGASATSCVEGAGFITIDEANAAAAGNIHAITHPLVCAIGHGINSGLASGSRWPAKRYDGGNTSLSQPYTTKEGMRFRLPPTFDPTDTASYNVGTWLTGVSPDTSAVNFIKAVGQALRDYGLICRDSTAGTGFAGLYIEDTPQTGRDSYGPYTGGLNMGVLSPALLDPIPWGSLEVLSAFRYPAKTQGFTSHVTFTADTNGTTTLANVSDFTNCYEGVLVSGAGIPPATAILSVNTGASTATISAAATATASGVTITPARRTNRLDAGLITSPGFQQLPPY